MSVEEQGEKRGEPRRKHERSRREQKDRSEKRPGVIASCLGKWWFELVALGLFSSGVLFLVEQLEIRATLFRGLRTFVGVVGNTVSDLWNLISSVRKSNLVGIVLILAAAWMVAYRLRGRAIHRYQTLPLEAECPECHEDLHRKERRLIDRLLQLILRVRIRRYACGKCSFRTSVWRARGESD